MRARVAAGLACLVALPLGAQESPLFVDVTETSGLAFRHFNGQSGKRYIPEIMGSGGGFLDYDGDGDMDALLLSGAPFPTTPPQQSAPRNRLFRNDGTGHFSDVTDASGLGHEGHGMGVAAGDIDNDGDIDVLVTNFGPDVLYRNLGDGSFEDITEHAGVGDSRWTMSAAFLDYDADGDLDLFVAAYLDFSVESFTPCFQRDLETYCHPIVYGPLQDRLYRNEGDGRFEDVTDETGIAGHLGNGLGVVAGDIDDDGDIDIYVANDSTANHLYINQLAAGGHGFLEEAVLYGVAYGEGARAEAGMGTDVGDYDGDGALDIVCTNLESQTNSLYRNEGGFASEMSFASGLGASTLPKVGFGVRFLDYELDGDLDLIVTNGHIVDNVSEIREGSEFAQPDMLFENQAGRFREVCAGCLPRLVGRGLATADIDGDGDEDVLIINNNDEARLLENRSELVGTAVGLRLEGAMGASNRDAYGARVSWSVGGEQRVREVHAAASYCATNDPRLLLAVPSDTELQRVTIRWPNGSTETLDLPPGSYHHVVQGQGVRARTEFVRR